MPVKIVRIIGRLNIGGPARQACYLHQNLSSKFQSVLIAGRLDGQEGDMSYLLASGEGVYWLESMSRPVRLLQDLVSVWRILRILQKERPDIVHTHTAKAGAVGRLAAILAGVPTIVHTYHGNVFCGYFGPKSTWLFIQVERLFNFFSARVIAISESQQRELASQYKVVRPEKISMIRVGFDLPDVVSEAERQTVRDGLGIARNDFVVLWVGRLVPVKNVGLLVEVIKRAQIEAPGTKFLIAGDGPDRDRFKSLSAEVRNFTLLGWQPDLGEYYAACDAALLTSINEGTPAALIEALAAERPFVATRAGGVVDIAGETVRILDNGAEQTVHGFLANADSKTILGCLKRLADDPRLREEMGQAGRRYVLREHSEQRLRQDIEALYLGLSDVQGFGSVPQ